MNHLFISYAHIDNESYSGTGEGWIDALHDRLEKRLSQLLGQRPEMWRDRKLKGNEDFSDAIAIALGNTAVLLTVLSPRYVESNSCRKELETFFQVASSNLGLRLENEHRVFKVVKTYLPLDEHPRELHKVLGYDFYVREEASGRFEEFDHELSAEKDKRYWKKFEALAQDIAVLLKRIEKKESAPAPAKGATVFLAETTSDLAEYRDDVRNELQQYGHVVLPDKPLPPRTVDLQRSVSEYLKHSRLSVHLIGEYYGVSPEDDSRSIISWQQELAMARGDSAEFSRLIWLPPGLQPKDERQRKFIETLQNTFHSTNGSDLIQTKIEDLKTIIQEKLNPTPKPTATEKPDDGLKRVYLICDKRDLDDIGELYSYLYKEGYEVLLPEFDENTMQSDKQHMLDCDAVLFFYAHSPEMWLRTRLKNLTGFGRLRPLSAVGVYVTGAETPQKKLFLTREAIVMKNFSAFDESILKPFMQQLSQAKGGTR